MREVTKIMISSEGHAWSKKKIGVLPVRLAESQASAQDRMSALAH
jgi:hypothetical protein